MNNNYILHGFPIPVYLISRPINALHEKAPQKGTMMSISGCMPLDREAVTKEQLLQFYDEMVKLVP